MFKSIQFIITITMALWLISTCQARTVILGFDGMDPQLLEQWMASGDMPHFKALAETGHYQPLSTTNPAQSPVAWASFATGLNPGEHGIFDFIHRDAEKFEPVYSISGVKEPEMINLFGWQLAVSQPSIYNKRMGKPFWLTAEQHGHKSSVLRVPVTYPPDNISSMLSGMGVPDLLGSQGTYTFYATKYINPGQKGGNIVRVKVINDRIDTVLNGPPNPFGGNVLTVPLILQKDQPNSIKIHLDGKEITLQEGAWSDWIAIDFSYAGVFSLSGMVRLHVLEAFPRVKLYVSPININPQSAELPIANPPEFAKKLSEDIGLYHTLGMPEETWSLNDGLIDSKTYLQMVETILAEREKMFFKQLADDSIELLVEVFVQTDRVSHMFWRGLDANHPTYDSTNELERNAIKWIYQQADRILGKTLQQLKPEDKLIVLSDHGFAPYYKHVNLNRWLHDNGFLALKSENLSTFSLKDVDWEKTTAYAMGLNGIYLNLAGREKHGIVSADNAEQVQSEISALLTQLVEPDTLNKVVNHVYASDDIYSGAESGNSPDLVVGYSRGYRASWQTVLGEAPAELISINTDNWSGDHCIDPVLVPGVLLTNFQLNQTPITGIDNIGALALSTLKQTGETSIDTSQAGFLDWPRDVMLVVFKPMQRYLPAVAALLLVGLLLCFMLYLIVLFFKKIPHIIVVSSTLKAIALVALFIIVWDAAKNTFSDSLMKNAKIRVTVQAIVSNELPQLNWYNSDNTVFEANVIGKNQWQLPLGDNAVELRESDGYALITLSNNKPVSSKQQKKWWHNVLSNKGGYLSQYSQVKAVIVDSHNKNNSWWIWLLLGFIVSLSLWKVFRKK